ncbi:MAG: hypothetical protein ACP5G2_06460 [Candidatus Bipolaricaulaceae bacterium]
MRKFWMFVAIGAVALLPFGAFADTGDATTATLTLNGVIYIEVTTEWEDLEINQEDIAGMAGSYFAWGDLALNVKAMTAHQVWSGYFADEGGVAVDPAFTDADNLIALIHTSDGTFWLPYNTGFESITNPTAGFDYTGTFGTDMVALFTGSNNMPSGTDKTYDVQLDPANLGDRTSGETIDFTIVFVVEDTSL